MVLMEVIKAGLRKLSGSITGPAEEVQSMITSASSSAASRLSWICRRESMAIHCASAAGSRVARLGE
ncbi:hypothetical protein D3C81_2149540 [compost metagenome]